MAGSSGKDEVRIKKDEVKATLRHHGTKIIDYAIRVAVISIVVVPALFFLSMSGGLGSEPPEHSEEIFGVILFIIIAPAYYTVVLVHAVGISVGFVDWGLGVILVPLFWGAISYCASLLCRLILRASHGTSNQAMRPAKKV
jgi:hypothetical protein